MLLMGFCLVNKLIKFYNDLDLAILLFLGIFKLARYLYLQEGMSFKELLTCELGKFPLGQHYNLMALEVLYFSLNLVLHLLA